RAHLGSRAAAHEEPVRARLHPQSRVGSGQGARPVARRRHPSRHQDGGRRVRHLPEPDGRRRPARREDLFHREQSHRADASAGGPMTAYEPRRRGGKYIDQNHRDSFFKRVTLCVSVSVLSLCLCGSSVSAQQQIDPSRWPNEFPPRPLAARPVNFPPYQMQTLPNGLRIVAVAHHEQPVVSIRLLVGAGASLDPKGKTGLAHLTASLLDQGTTTATAAQMNDEIDFIGGSMGAGAGTDLSYLNVLVMKESFERGLQMLSDMARRPAFKQEELERQRQQLLSS